MARHQTILEEPDVITVDDVEPLSELISSLKPMNTPTEVAECSGIKTGTLARWRSMGVGPRFIKIGRTVHYPKEELVKCFRTHIYQSAREAREGRAT